MFDLGWSELFIIGLITLLVVGPKELPRVLRTVSQLMAKARGLAREFQSSVDEMVRESELDDLKKEINSLKSQADVRKQVNTIMDEAEAELNADTAKSGTDKRAAVFDPDKFIVPAPADADTSKTDDAASKAKDGPENTILPNNARAETP